MRAKKEAWGEKSRIKLSEVLPLKTPISIGIEASSYCNLKCSYCVHGLEEKTFPQQFMSLEAFEKAIDSLRLFENKVKNIVFAISGEPLTNKQLPVMIKYIKDKDVTEKITVFTNAVLLTEEYSKKLIDAGLDILRVSIQGVTDERYLELCGVKVNYEQIVNNVKYFYEYRNKTESLCHIFVKIADQSLFSHEDEEKFYRDFGDICDQISVETIVPIRYEVDYDETVNTHCNLVKQESTKTDVCSQAFYAMYVRANGNVNPCCIVNANDLVMGSINQEGLFDIWNNSKLQEFRKMQLKRERYNNGICRGCSYPECGLQTNDKIDHIANELYTKMFSSEN